MKYKIISEVSIPTVGICKHEHIQEFDKHENVFGRVLAYHQYMNKTFPKCEYKLIKAERA